MKFKNILIYAMILAFLAWCLIAFRADIAQLNFDQVWRSKSAILIATLLSLTNYVMRILRWSLFLSKLGHSLPVGFSGLTYLAGFAFTLSPGKVGEMARGGYYQKIGIPLTTTAAAFFVERLMDLLAMLALVFLAFSSVKSYTGLLWGLMAVIAAMLAVLALAPWASISASLENSAHFPAALKKPLSGIVSMLLSAKALLRPSLLTAGFLIGLVAWGSEGVGLMVLGDLASSAQMDWATATGIYSIAIIIGALSFLPGGLGSTEAVMVALLAAHGYATPDAILLTLVCRLLTLWFAVLIGWGAVISLRRYPLLMTAPK